jgi:hypothetical protein
MSPIQNLIAVLFALSSTTQTSEKGKKQKIATRNMPARVLFANNVEIHQIPHRLDHSNEEISSIWLTPTDWIRIREENQMVCSAVLEGATVDDLLDDDETIRGLENCLPVTAVERMNMIKFARLVVLKTQAKWRQGCAEEKSIALFYYKASMKSQQSAHSRGIDDSDLSEVISA